MGGDSEIEGVNIRERYDEEKHGQICITWGVFQLNPCIYTVMVCCPLLSRGSPSPEEEDPIPVVDRTRTMREDA